MEGATPARQANDSGVGKRARQSPDLGEQPGGADGAGAGQGGEDMRVGVQGELFGDLRVERLDLGRDAGERGDHGPGDVGVGGTLVTGGAARGTGEPVVEHGRSSQRRPASRPGA